MQEAMVVKILMAVEVTRVLTYTCENYTDKHILQTENLPVFPPWSHYHGATLQVNAGVEMSRSGANHAAGLQDFNVDFVGVNGEGCVSQRDWNYVLQAAQIFVSKMDRNWWCRMHTAQ
jgi:hypothetical protein